MAHKWSVLVDRLQPDGDEVPDHHNGNGGILALGASFMMPIGRVEVPWNLPNGARLGFMVILAILSLPGLLAVKEGMLSWAQRAAGEPQLEAGLSIRVPAS